MGGMALEEIHRPVLPEAAQGAAQPPELRRPPGPPIAAGAEASQLRSHGYINLADLRLGAVQEFDGPAVSCPGLAAAGKSDGSVWATETTCTGSAVADDTESDRDFPTQDNELSENEEAPRTASTDLGVWALVLITVLCGCAAQAPYEMMNSFDRGCGPLISLVEHLFGILASLNALRQQRKLPWSLHLRLAATNVCYTLLLNLALSSQLPTLVLMTMKSGHLAASMLLGMCVLGHRYSTGQYLAVAWISAGLVLASISGSRTGGSAGAAAAGLSAGLGVLSLLGALLSRAAAGVLQEVGSRDFGVPVAELLFYRNALGLPLVLVQWPQIAKHAARWSAQAGVAGPAWPWMWVLLATNITQDFAVKVAISKLTSRTSSLSTTLVLTFQRFVSFVLSTSILSSGPIGWDLWVSALTVLAGTILHVTASKQPSKSIAKPKCE